MTYNPYRIVCCGAFLLTISGCDQRRALPATPAMPARNSVMVLDQANTAAWDGGWTVTSNDLRQTFTPALPRLMAVEVDLMLGNPGPTADRVTLTIYDAGGARSPAHRGTWRLPASVAYASCSLARLRSRRGSRTQSE